MPWFPTPNPALLLFPCTSATRSRAPRPATAQKYEFHDVRYRACGRADLRAAVAAAAAAVDTAREEVATAVGLARKAKARADEAAAAASGGGGGSGGSIDAKAAAKTAKAALAEWRRNEQGVAAAKARVSVHRRARART